MPLSTPLVIASHNAGKVREIGDLLRPLNVEAVSAAALDLPEPEETGDTFEANAVLKAVSAAKISGKWALADDSGLCVKALNDAPGIYSARWAGPTKDFPFAMQRIEHELLAIGVNPEGAQACFICVLSLCSPDGKVVSFEGRVDGILTFPPRGAKGFGYDPIFIPKGHDVTFAEMDAADKHAMSHRARALEQLKTHLTGALTA